MKITFARKAVFPVDFTELTFTEGNVVRFTVEGERQTLQVGVGALKPLTRRALMRHLRKGIRAAAAQKVKRVTINLESSSFQAPELSQEDLVYLIGSNVIIGGFEFRTFKTAPKEGWEGVEEVLITGVEVTPALQIALKRGIQVAEAINKCRELANTPGGDMTPKLLAKAAQESIKGTNVKVVILGRKEIAKEKMGAILGVAKGSTEEPQFIVMEYWGAGKPTNTSRARKELKPIVLIGKGVTFDTGGLNLKPSDSLLDMHLDMSGGAAVIHTVALAAKLKLKKNVIGLVPAVENMPSGESYRPGDILRSASGRTIEVLNTDAEGRIILADAITHAKRFNPRLVIDVATLTGAALVALGQHASAVLSPDKELREKLLEAGERSGDLLWPFPLWDEYEQYVKGNFADVANIPSLGSTRYGGVIHGGMFLYQFAKDLGNVPWAHIDMASRMLPAPNESLARGATGEPIRLLLEIVEVY